MEKKNKEEKFMSLMNWFEDKHRFGGLIGALIKKVTKGYIFSEKESICSLFYFLSRNCN
jgi:hypothetical protein